MRHAVVVAPPRFVIPVQGSIFATPEPVGPLCAALSRAGYRVVVVPTSADLETDFERALAGVGSSDDLLVFLGLETAAHSDPVAALLGEEAAWLAIRALADAVEAREPSSVLFVVEACHDGADGDPLLAAEHVDAIVRALDVKARGRAALVAVRAAKGAVAGSWPFTRHLLYALQDPEARDAGGAARAARIVERLRAAHPEQGQVQSFSFVPGRVDFVVAVSAEPAHPPPSMPPPSTARPPTSIPPPYARASVPPSSSHTSGPPPSLPAIEPLVDLAAGAHARGAWEEALAGYKAALMVAADGDFETRASIYARIGDVKRAQGKLREAELNYEKALRAEPGHRPSLDALIELATQAKEPRRAIEWRRKRLVGLDSAGEIVAELQVIARANAEQLGDLRAAAEALEEAHAIAPRDRGVVDALRAAYEALHRWPRVVELLSEAGGLEEDPAQRAAFRFAAADVALARLRDEERGLALLERALDDDPRQDRALQALVAVRTARGEWQQLDAAYARLIDRLAKLDDAARAWDACRKLGLLRRDRLHDVRGAVEAFTGAVSCKPSDVESRAMLADLHLATGPDGETQALAQFERVAQLAPMRASTYSRLFALHRKAGRTDRAWLAATAIEELGAMDVDAQLVVDQFRAEGPIRPSRALDDAGWDDLRAPGADDVVADVLRAVVDAARAAQVEELREARKLVALDPARKQGAASTVSAVRSFHWAAQVLAVETPSLYVIDDVPGGIAAVRAGEPSTVLGPDVLRGIGTKDLAFLAGRQLTYFRREHYALVHYPTLAEISVLFLGALKVAMPAVPVPANLSEAVAKTRRQLLRHLGEPEKRALAAAVERLDARGGRVDLLAWLRGVELTAQRAGLLLCGDLRTATTRLRAEKRAIGELDVDAKRADLVGFCVSEAFARVRRLLGVDARSSVQPPPVSQREVG